MRRKYKTLSLTDELVSSSEVDFFARLRSMKKNILAFLFAGMTQVGMGQKDTIVLKELQVNVNRTTQKILTSGRNVYAIDHQTMESMAVQSIDESMRYAPGLDVQSRGGFGVQSDVVIRASTFNQTLVLMDGIPISDPLTGHLTAYLPIGLSLVQNIEVLKGPSSALYGAGAVGGAVNLVTKELNNGERFEADFTLKGGSHSYLGWDGFVKWKVGEWNFRVQSWGNQSDGEVFQNPNTTAQTDVPETYNTWFDLHNVGFSIARKINDQWDVQFNAGWDERSFSAKYFYTVSTLDESVENIKIGFTSLSFKRTSERHKTIADLMLRRSEDEFVFNPGFTPNRHIMYSGLLQLFHEYSLNTRSKIIFGGQADARSIESNDRGNHENGHVGIFGAWHYSNVKGFNLNTNLRLDFDDNYGLEFNPQLFASYLIGNWNLRAGAGRAIRGGDYTERFISTNLEVLSTGRNLGNPDLVAERSWSFEAGTDWFIASEIKASLTAFVRLGEDLIDYVPTNASDINSSVELDPNGVYLYAQNVGSTLAQGLETELQFQKKWNQNWSVSGLAGFTWQETTNADSIVSKYLSSHATHIYSGMMSLGFRRFDLGITALSKVRNPDFANALNVAIEPDYFVMDARLSASFWSNRAIFSVQVRNVFDESYADILGAQMPGRWWITAVRIRL